MLPGHEKAIVCRFTACMVYGLYAGLAHETLNTTIMIIFKTNHCWHYNTALHFNISVILVSLLGIFGRQFKEKHCLFIRSANTILVPWTILLYTVWHYVMWMIHELFIIIIIIVIHLQWTFYLNSLLCWDKIRSEFPRITSKTHT